MPLDLGRMLAVLGAAWALVALAMLALWQAQRATRDATAVDAAWAAALGAVAVLIGFLAEGHPARRLLVATMVATAGWRLALHLYLDRVATGVEDGRYRRLRERWGARAERHFFWLYQAQALLVAWLALTLWLACSARGPLAALDLAALGLWCAAFLGEALADEQLARFKSDPANLGRTCRAGLWRCSRHPNYFFQWLLWCAYALPALGAPLGWLALLGPLTMLALIRRVTGIPPTEAQALATRGDDYREYQRTTSAFWPWFPRGGGSPCSSR